MVVRRIANGTAATMLFFMVAMQRSGAPLGLTGWMQGLILLLMTSHTLATLNNFIAFPVFSFGLSSVILLVSALSGFHVLLVRAPGVWLWFFMVGVELIVFRLSLRASKGAGS
jgi:hypothetical protein